MRQLRSLMFFATIWLFSVKRKSPLYLVCTSIFGGFNWGLGRHFPQPLNGGVSHSSMSVGDTKCREVIQCHEQNPHSLKTAYGGWQYGSMYAGHDGGTGKIDRWGSTRRCPQMAPPEEWKKDSYSHVLNLWCSVCHYSNLLSVRVFHICIAAFKYTEFGL